MSVVHVIAADNPVSTAYYRATSPNIFSSNK